MLVGDDLSGLSGEALARVRARAEFEAARGSRTAAALRVRVEAELCDRRRRQIQARRGLNDGVDEAPAFHLR
jgi:hypothetical protein